MEGITRRLFVAASIAAVSLTLASCSSSGNSSKSASSEATDVKHVIGVIVYDVADDEVAMIREYLVDYIAGVCFDDVQFVYSGAITDEEELIAFIDEVAALGGEGIMSFFNIDLAAEVERCAQHGMYHIVASGTVSDEDFAKASENEYFLGCVGPNIEMEYIAGSRMVRHFVANKVGDRYFVMSGGAHIGNEMHYQRTFGILDALETAYGVDLGQTRDLARVSEATTLSAGDLTVTISPGYVAIENMRQDVISSFKPGQYDVVLSTIPVEPVLAMLSEDNLKIAQVDCYSQENQLLFLSGKLSYLAGKYGSIVGPSFVALYNAITGHRDEMREEGKAFRIVQDFWSSSSAEDFNEKYSFASNIMTPSYNYEDLSSICIERTPTATYDDFKKLTSASSYEEAKKRRSN